MESAAIGFIRNKTSGKTPLFTGEQRSDNSTCTRNQRRAQSRDKHLVHMALHLSGSPTALGESKWLPKDRVELQGLKPLEVLGLASNNLRRAVLCFRIFALFNKLKFLVASSTARFKLNPLPLRRHEFELSTATFHKIVVLQSFQPNHTSWWLDNTRATGSAVGNRPKLHVIIGYVSLPGGSRMIDRLPIASVEKKSPRFHIAGFQHQHRHGSLDSSCSCFVGMPHRLQ